MAILALMLARYPSMERFIPWYRQQIERIEAGELSIPARLVYEDDQLDLPSQPGPDTVSVEELRWRTTSVRLESDHLAAVRVQPAAARRADPARGAWNEGVGAGTQGSVQTRRSEQRHGFTRIRMRTSSRCIRRRRCPGLWGR